MKRYSVVIAFAYLMGAGLLARGQSGGVTGLPPDSCRDYASAGYSCCIYVRGHRESARCAADFYSSHSHSMELATEGVAHYLVHRLGHTASALRLTPASFLISSLVVNRLDLTGVDGRTSAGVARCMIGESVPRGPGASYIGRSGYSNPHYWEGQAGYRVHEDQVRAYLEGLRRACHEQTVRRAVARVQRPRGHLEWCGRLVTDRPARPLLGPTPPETQHIRASHFCSPSYPNCCWRNYLVSTANAYCETNPLPNDRFDRVCVPSVAP